MLQLPLLVNGGYCKIDISSPKDRRQVEHPLKPSFFSLKQAGKKFTKLWKWVREYCIEAHVVYKCMNLKGNAMPNLRCQVNSKHLERDISQSTRRTNAGSRGLLIYPAPSKGLWLWSILLLLTKSLQFNLASEWRSQTQISFQCLLWRPYPSVIFFFKSWLWKMS